ncbi:hypothetical protein [Pyxidicoccus trucidator]|uniref:hypothetical protein n=1 Tax=Pyxidicoccus trucidator TaxID=2709662 RepID=UPI0013DD687C|nr:hypothetical protein [Pyxidicoccus trucidator]
MTPKQLLEREFSDALDRTLLTVLKKDYPLFRTAMLSLLREMQAKARTAFVRREMARRVAELLLGRACMPAEPKATLLLEFKRMTRLGFSSIDRRVHIAAMLGRWVELGEEDSPIVRPFIADTARRIRCLKRGRFKHELMKDIEQAMVRTGMKPG